MSFAGKGAVYETSSAERLSDEPVTLEMKDVRHQATGHLLFCCNEFCVTKEFAIDAR